MYLKIHSPLNTKTRIVSELAIEKMISFDVCYIVTLNFQLDDFFPKYALSLTSGSRYTGLCLASKVSVTIFMKLDTHHILKLLSSEHVTTFKIKLGILVTKLKLQVNVCKFCHQYQWGEFHVF